MRARYMPLCCGWRRRGGFVRSGASRKTTGRRGSIRSPKPDANNSCVKPRVGVAFRASSAGCCSWRTSIRPMLRAVFSRICGTFQRRRLDEEFDQEVRGHLDMLAERFIRNGMGPAEAFFAARRQFGGVTQVKENLRERRALPPLDVLMQDVRHAFRQLRKAKGFTASAALTLALGIGATTAVFAVLDAVVLRPL